MNRYVDLDIDLLDYQHLEGREFLRARVAKSPAGEQRDSDTLKRPFPSRLRERLRKLERRELHFDELILMGEELASLLLPPAVRDFYKRSLEKLSADKGLRIRVRTHDPEMAVLPWEYVYVKRPDVPRGRKGPEGFLCLDRKLSLIRYEIMKESSIAIQPMKHHEIRTIALLSDVRDDSLAALDLDREELNLRQALEGLGGIDTRFLRPGTSSQLQEMLSENAQVFHFSGHGLMHRKQGRDTGSDEGGGQLIFSGDNNSPEPVDVGTLGLQLRGKGIRLVVLNACEAAMRDPVSPWTGIAPVLLRQGIPAVVGMQYTIGDGSAIAFSRRFYRTLAGGESIDAAVVEGRLGILTRSGGGERDWGVPVLYMRSSQSKLFPPPIVPLRRNLALLTASILLLSSWFFLHIYPWVADGASELMNKVGMGVGALPILLAVWKMTGTFLAKTAKSEKTSVVERWLRHRRAKSVLMSVLAASVLLFATTGSIYLQDDGPANTSVRLAVLMEGDIPFPPVRELVSSAEHDRIAGGPFFFFPPPGDLRLRVEEPIGWGLKQDEPIRPLPWRSEKLSVKKDLKKVELRVLWLAPGDFLMSLLPAKGQLIDSVYQVRITIDGKPHLIDDFRKGVIWLGGSRELIQSQISNESDSDGSIRRGKCLSSPPESEAGSELLSKWNANMEIIETDIIKADDTVKIEVIDLLQPAMSITRTIPASDIEAGTIKPVCL